jgi:hypothetical protein
MTLTDHDQPQAATAWDEPDGLTPRGTLIVIPGRGEEPALYERFGRRLSTDAYRVRVLPDPSAGPASEAAARAVTDGRHDVLNDVTHRSGHGRAVPGAAAARPQPAGHRPG